MIGLKRGSVKLLSHQEEWNKNAEKSLVKMGGEQGIKGIPRLLIEVSWAQGLRFGWCWDVVHLTTEIPKHLDDTDRTFLVLRKALILKSIARKPAARTEPAESANITFRKVTKTKRRNFALRLSRRSKVNGTNI